MLLGFLLVMNVMAPMRDGVKLATDVYLPEKEGKYPVLLYRTPYNKDGQKGAAAYFNKFGYAVVVQDCRGRFKSEGEFYPFVNEGKDGYDTIEWAAAQPWSNGKVGTIGGSYLAWDQYHAAMYKPPHLVAMFAIVGGANLLNEYGHPGGTPNPGWPMWILNSAMSSPAAQRDPDGRAALASAAKNPREWLALHPRERSKVFAPFPDHKKIYDDMYAHTELDSYWKQRGFYTAGYFGEMKDVPVLFLSGWYDYFGDGLLDTYMALSKRQRTMKRLVMGPWPHGVGAATCGDGNFGERAALDAQALAVDWFDHWMKGDPLEPVNAHPVRYFRMGGGDGGRDEKGRLQHGGAWLTAPAWPLPNARGEKFYLRQGGALAKQPAKGAPASFVFDPEDPVPTIGGRYAGAGTPGCFQDQI